MRQVAKTGVKFCKKCNERMPYDRMDVIDVGGANDNIRCLGCWDRARGFRK
tara:strand:- start:24 stop:176 length:153 start_codon:yes stop_codon:yes gene_type:complete